MNSRTIFNLLKLADEHQGNKEIHSALVQAFETVKRIGDSNKTAGNLLNEREATILSMNKKFSIKDREVIKLKGDIDDLRADNDRLKLIADPLQKQVDSLTAERSRWLKKQRRESNKN